MRRQFREDKTTQAAAYLLRLRGGSMAYMKLIKLLYVADRITLLKYGRPITYDYYFSLDKGPILSRTLDLITEGPQNGINGYWNMFISKPIGYEVQLSGDDCPVDELSEAECGVLDHVFNRLGSLNRWALVDMLHQYLPEWQDPHGSSLPIDYTDIFEAENRDHSEANEIEAEVSHLAFLDNLLSL